MEKVIPGLLVVKCTTSGCGKQCGQRDAFCANGHAQKESKNLDRHLDDEDSDDGILMMLPGQDNFSKYFPTGAVKDHRDIAEINDGKKKVQEAVRGSRGVRPANAIPKTTISVWLVEPPPAKYNSTGVHRRNLESRLGYGFTLGNARGCGQVGS